MTQDYYNGIAFLLNQLHCSKNELEIRCNDGAICINMKTLNYTYIGTFGTYVSRLFIKENILNDDVKKLQGLAACIDVYSRRSGGFNFITK